MFTGIVEEVGEVLEASEGRLRVAASLVASDAKAGDSISVDGVDLTLTELREGEMSFGVMPETYRRTTLGRLGKGSRVNLERSLRAWDRLSGHVVRGVVEATGTLAGRQDDGDAVVLTFRAPAELLAHMVERGPVTVNGVSLTVIARGPDSFSVSTVRYTQERTNLLQLPVGAAVNLETDIMMRYVSQLLADRGFPPGGGAPPPLPA
jgi:riboflavin synthase